MAAKYDMKSYWRREQQKGTDALTVLFLDNVMGRRMSRLSIQYVNNKTQLYIIIIFFKA